MNFVLLLLLAFITLPYLSSVIGPVIYRYRALDGPKPIFIELIQTRVFTAYGCRRLNSGVRLSVSHDDLNANCLASL